MTVILCADDRNGLLFNQRRLSRDGAVCREILALCGENILWMNSYSASIFPQNTPNIRLWGNFPEDVMDGDFCFVENEDISKL